MGKITLIFILFLYGFASKEMSLIEQMWTAFRSKNYQEVHTLNLKCNELFLIPAVEAEADIKGGKKYDHKKMMPLNIMAECLYLDADAYRLEGKKDIANYIYKMIIKYFPHGESVDLGWIWLPSEDAENRLKQMEMEDDESKKP